MTDIPVDRWLEDDTVRQVIDDLAPALKDVFPSDGFAFTPAPGLPSVIRSGGAAVVAWEYRGDEQRNPLARSAPLRTVTLRGITVVVGEGEKALFHRYIDWAGVYDQLGMVPGRPDLGDESADAADADVVPGGGGTNNLIPRPTLTV